MTFIVIPDTEHNSFSLQFPTYLIYLFVCVIVIAALTLVTFVHSYQKMTSFMDELYHLRQVAAVQHEQIESLADLAGDLEADLVRLRELDAEVRALLQDTTHLQEVTEQDGKVVSAEAPAGLDAAVGGPERIAGVFAAPVYASLPSADRRQPPNLLSAPVSRSSAALSLDQPRTYGVARATMALARLAQMRSEATEQVANLDDGKVQLTQHMDYLGRRPSVPPVEGWISSPYGWRVSPFGWGRTFHKGSDIAADWGQDIVATGDGVVTFSGWKEEYGRTVIIDHGYGFVTLYAHTTRNLVAAGDFVRRGDVVALVGSTGASTGPHLHYEVWVSGVPVDPAPYMKPPGGS